MSGADEAKDEVCASCGIAAVDDVKLLVECVDGCDIVKYCSHDCQKNHRSQHKDLCEKRLAVLRDNDLFTLPDISHLGECPICCLPLPIDPTKFRMMSCCCKLVCNGCNIANTKREVDAGLRQRCAFCREPAPKSQEEANKQLMKRVEAIDPVAMCKLGLMRRDELDYDTALKYLTKAAELGDMVAHYNLSLLYEDAKFLCYEGVEEDIKKFIYHMEEAAIGGVPMARQRLGREEELNGRFERAKKHYIIAANLGYHDSLQLLKELYAGGHASKEEYADALRAYQAAVEATKSAERDKADAFYKRVAAQYPNLRHGQIGMP